MLKKYELIENKKRVFGGKRAFKQPNQLINKLITNFKMLLAILNSNRYTNIRTFNYCANILNKNYC